LPARSPFAVLYVCMCVCMHVCMYVCMYVYMYICMYVCICACMYVYVRVYMYVCVYVCMYICRYVCVYVCMCIMLWPILKYYPLKNRRKKNEGSQLCVRIRTFHFTITEHRYFSLRFQIFFTHWSKQRFLGASEAGSKSQSRRSEFYS